MKRTLLLILLTGLLVACANLGTPDGGPYDEDPPKITGTSPKFGAVNTKSKKIVLTFDENIKLDSPSEKVIISPPQINQPNIEATGKRITIELMDSLKPGATYTIDFSDAIQDNNEGNPMDDYAFTFSTGESVDTFQVSGYVLNAADLEPIKGILVGLYRIPDDEENIPDSIFTTREFERVSRTNASGRFVIKGLNPEAQYRVFALQDQDQNFFFSQKSEMVGFNSRIFSPSAKPDIRQDTVWHDSIHYDSIVYTPYTHFYPDDIVLMAFQELQTNRYLAKQPERINADRMTFYFSYGHEELPVIRGLNFDADSAFIIESTPKRDTLTYWLRDTMLVNQDTLRFEMDYHMTDSTGELILKTDTLEVLAKTPYAKRMKQLQKEMDDWQKEQDKKKKREEPYDSIFPAKPLEIRYEAPSSMDPGKAVYIESPTPLASLDTTAIHLYSKIDSLWYRAPFEFQRRDSMLRHFVVKAEWRPGTEYSFEVDSAAFCDIYGMVSKSYKQGIQVKSLDEYATLSLQLTDVSDTTAIVLLLDAQEKIQKQTRTSSSGMAKFNHVVPGTYYVRAFIDSNGNGQWDTGDYDSGQQPEEVYYYPKEIETKAKFDIKLKWNTTAAQRYQQKPGKLIKQKDEKNKKKLQNRNEERAKKLGITYEKKEIVRDSKKK